MIQGSSSYASTLLRHDVREKMSEYLLDSAGNVTLGYTDHLAIFPNGNKRTSRGNAKTELLNDNPSNHREHE